MMIVYTLINPIDLTNYSYPYYFLELYIYSRFKFLKVKLILNQSKYSISNIFIYQKNSYIKYTGISYYTRNFYMINCMKKHFSNFNDLHIRV